MDDYISRKKLLDSMEDILNDENCPLFVVATVDQLIEEAPSEDVEQVVHARWIESTYCSNCNGFAEDYDDRTIMSFSDYCPYCGAKMDEEKR